MIDDPTVPIAAAPEPHRARSGPRPAADELAAGDTFGRFRVLDLLGAGGMGVVVAAHDPLLQRRVAIKLVRSDAAAGSDGAPAAEARMVREARAMARLTHPNVVTVYEVGVDHGGIFLVMELVDGGTLAEWLRQPRPWRDVVARFAAAGRGLAAAHAAGLVHRDFKPANVLLGRDGRVRVTDFGLVGMAWAEDRGGDAGVHADLSSDTLLGTPHYMAPEQHERGRVGDRADQWAFCASLYEALYRERPFAGHTRAELVLDVCGGAVPTPADERGVPARLRALVGRGLARDPADRFPSMTALLAELDRDPVQTRRRLATAGIVAALAGAAVYAWSARDRPAGGRGLCADDVEAAWAPVGRAAARTRFVALRGAAGDDGFARADRRLDAYLASWEQARRRVCRADDASPTFHARMGCLAGVRAEVSALIDVFAAAGDPLIVDGAVAAVASLPAITACERAAPVAGPAVPAAHRAQLDAVEAELRRVEALYRAGLVRDAVTAADHALATARASGVGMAEARAHLALGRARERIGAYADAERDLRRAAELAAAAGDDRTVAEAWTTLLWVVARGGRPADSLELGTLVTAAVARAGDDARLRAELWFATGVALVELGRYDEAAPVLTRARAVWTDELDPSDPGAARLVMTLGNVDLYRGDVDGARTRYQEALAVREAALGPLHPALAPILNNLGDVELERGEPARALELCTRARALATAVQLDPDGPLRCIGRAHADLGHPSQARELLERAVAAGGDRAPYALLNLADVEGDLGAHAAALAHCDQALAGFVNPADRPRALACRGRALLDLGRVDEARGPLTEATAAFARDRGHQRERGALRFALARSSSDRAVARELAVLARADFEAAGAVRRVADVDAWLDHRRPRR